VPLQGTRREEAGKKGILIVLNSWGTETKVVDSSWRETLPADASPLQERINSVCYRYGIEGCPEMKAIDGTPKNIFRLTYAIDVESL